MLVFWNKFNVPSWSFICSSHWRWEFSLQNVLLEELSEVHMSGRVEQQGIVSGEDAQSPLPSHTREHLTSVVTLDKNPVMSVISNDESRAPFKQPTKELSMLEPCIMSANPPDRSLPGIC